MQIMTAAKQAQAPVRTGAVFVMLFTFLRKCLWRDAGNLIRLSGVDKSILFFTEFCMF